MAEALIGSGEPGALPPLVLYSCSCNKAAGKADVWVCPPEPCKTAGHPSVHQMDATLMAPVVEQTAPKRSLCCHSRQEHRRSLPVGGGRQGLERTSGPTITVAEQGCKPCSKSVASVPQDLGHSGYHAAVEVLNKAGQALAPWSVCLRISCTKGRQPVA